MTRTQTRLALAAVVVLLALSCAWSSARASAFTRTYMTWYGPGFYGNRTACGQRMTRKLIGVAHRSLPCGTRVEVRYHHHDRVVRVVDRCGCAANSDLDATPRLAIHLTGHPPHSMHGVRWRVVR